MLLSPKAEWKTDRPRRRGPALVWNSFLSALLIAWGLIALRSPWGSLSPGILPSVAAAVVSYLLCIHAAIAVKPWLKWGLRLLPWILLLPWAADAVRGLLLWLNCILSQWNTLHRDGLSLFQTEATAQSVAAAALLCAAALGELTWYLVARRRLLLCGVLGLGLLLMQLLTGTFSPLVWSLWSIAYLGLWMSRTAYAPPRQALRLWLACTAAFLLCALSVRTDSLSGVTQLRHDAAQELHTLRYGTDTLPQGHLRDASKLGQGDQELLSVQTQQEKALYLRAFVGAEYADGVWLPLSGAAYGGTYAGMLAWLKTQDFDPLTQPAAYYALCSQDTLPERNTIRVHVTEGSRCYLYLPATTETTSLSYNEQKDLRMLPRGPLGANLYTADEYSSSRPSELTIRADWVADPQTEAQSRYTQAEAVYRTFVYDSYTQVDARLQPILQELFWQDYAPENDGIYSAVDRVRSVLRQRTVYTTDLETAAEDSDALEDFLIGTRRGNAVLYASAAVQALRSHGIPSRYVEGYYLSSAAAAGSPDGTVSLTGQDSHAWVEIYFDGIGWLPVDVTPGYYYDAVALREMVALPDAVHKTAALDDSADGSEDISQVAKPTEPVPPVELLRDTSLVLLGLAAVVVLAATLRYSYKKLSHLLSNTIKKHRYLHADACKRAQLLEAWIYAALSAHGLNACLGWKAAATDAEISRRIASVAPGEYSRTASLLEKFVYGGMEPEPHELRVLQIFLEKLVAAPVSEHRRKR